MAHSTLEWDRKNNSPWPCVLQLLSQWQELSFFPREIETESYAERGGGGEIPCFHSCLSIFGHTMHITCMTRSSATALQLMCRHILHCHDGQAASTGN